MEHPINAKIWGGQQIADSAKVLFSISAGCRMMEGRTYVQEMALASRLPRGLPVFFRVLGGDLYELGEGGRGRVEGYQ